MELRWCGDFSVWREVYGLQSMSYLFVSPAVATGLAVVVVGFNKRSVERHIALIVVSLPTAIVLVPALDTLFQLTTPRPGNPDSELPLPIAVP